MEVVPSIVGVSILAATYKRFQFSRLIYVMVLLHSLILFWGGQYTYAENPLFEYLKHVFGWQRNNYDKLGHFAQGFFPAFIIRELFIRQVIVLKKSWNAFLTVSVVALITVTYEFLEWWAALLIGQNADAFLGTQGYVWDTQSDMLFAVIGGICVVLFFGVVHDRIIAKIGKR